MWGRTVQLTVDADKALSTSDWTGFLRGLTADSIATQLGVDKESTGEIFEPFAADLCSDILKTDDRLEDLKRVLNTCLSAYYVLTPASRERLELLSKLVDPEAHSHEQLKSALARAEQIATQKDAFWLIVSPQPGYKTIIERCFAATDVVSSQGSVVSALTEKSNAARGIQDSLIASQPDFTQCFDLLEPEVASFFSFVATITPEAHGSQFIQSKVSKINEVAGSLVQSSLRLFNGWLYDSWKAVVICVPCWQGDGETVASISDIEMLRGRLRCQLGVLQQFENFEFHGKPRGFVLESVGEACKTWRASLNFRIETLGTLLACRKLKVEVASAKVDTSKPVTE